MPRLETLCLGLVKEAKKKITISLEYVHNLLAQATEPAEMENVQSHGTALSNWKSLLGTLWQKHVSADFGGWQLLLILHMLVITPFFCVSLFNNQLAQYTALNSSFATVIYSILMVFVVISVCGFSVFGAIELWRKRDWTVVQQVARVLWVTGPLAIFVLQVFIPWLIFGALADSQTVSNILMHLLLTLGIAYAWTLYLLNSEQMHVSYHASMTGRRDVFSTDFLKSATNIVVGNKVPFYILLVFAVLLFTILKYHTSSSGTIRHRINKTEQLDAMQQTANPVVTEMAAVPKIKLGDAYILESIDSAHPTNNHKTKRVVTAVTGEGFELSVVNLKSKHGKARILKFDKGWNLIATRNADHSGYDYSPALEYYAFPLFPGKTWKQSSIETDINTGATKEHVIVGEVGAWEDITVPAGTFYALKVSLKTILFDPKRQQKTVGTDVSWYSPEVKRSVKAETSLTDSRGNVERSTLLLVQYTTQQ